MTCVPNFLFSDFYLILLFNFKIGRSLGLSCLRSSMFIIKLIIRIIKTTCFYNTIFYFHEIFDTHLQKGLVYFYTKKFLPLLLYFWNYNPSLNEQLISLTDAQAHL